MSVVSRPLRGAPGGAGEPDGSYSLRIVAPSPVRRAARPGHLALPGAAGGAGPQGAEGQVQELGPRVRVVAAEPAALPGRVLRRVRRPPRIGISAFPIFLLSGLLVWNLFATALMSATSSIAAERDVGEEGVLPPGGAAAGQRRRRARPLLAPVLRARRRDAGRRAGTSTSGTCGSWCRPCVTLLLLTAALCILCSAVNVYARDLKHLIEVVAAGVVLADADRLPVGLFASRLAQPGADVDRAAQPGHRR